MACPPQWIHEIKHDGFQVILQRSGDRARVFTRRGYDWSDRYPIILQALKSLKVRSVTIDGEAVWCVAMVRQCSFFVALASVGKRT